MRSYEEAVNHGQAVAEALIALRQAGYKPDIIYGHTWGQTLFVKEIIDWQRIRFCPPY